MQQCKGSRHDALELNVCGVCVCVWGEGGRAQSVRRRRAYNTRRRDAPDASGRLTSFSGEGNVCVCEKEGSK